MAKINHYLTMLLFTVMFLVGLQIPAFMDQYTKRVDAQWVEASRALAPYQKIADKYHNGNMNGLIELHQNSDNKTFNAEAIAISRNVERQEYLASHLEQLNNNTFSAASTILLNVDEEIYARTYQQFTMSVQFSKVSLLFAAFMAVLSCGIYELIQLILKKTGLKMFSRRKHSH